MGGGGTTADRGEYSSFNCLDICTALETLVHSKYSDTQSPNYKQLSKKIILSLKSNNDQRKTISETKDQASLIDFFSGFINQRMKPLAAVQENSGNVTGNTGGNN